VSNAIRYDSLLVRALARELDHALTGSRLDAAFFDRERMRVTLRSRARRRTDPTPPSLLWQLHPQSGHITAAGADDPAGGRVQLPGSPRIASVDSPSDERLLAIELEAGDAPAGMARRIIIELITNQWNAVAIGIDDRIVAVLRERETRGRVLRAGVAYRPPPAGDRIGAAGADAAAVIDAETWLAELGPAAPGERLNALLRFAWTSPLNAPAILGDAGVDASEAALLRALERYRALVRHATAGDMAARDAGTHAFVVQLDGRWQPYPEPIGTGAEPMDSLLAAFETVAAREAAAPVAEDATEAALAAVARRMDAVRRKIERLRAESAGAEKEAQQLRRHADLLLAQLHRVERGAERVELDDFEGGTVSVALDPALDGAGNANRIYDVARKRDRAGARIPALVAAAARELARLDALAGRMRDGTASPAELEQLSRGRAVGSRDGGPALPYRAYRTSGGFEVRVGRGSKANDDLTFRHSSPTDVWLHARDVAGAHVVLRWPDAAANPPAADIAEAAVLAALYSRARTSGVVAVDWTRRKYVRKPRKAPPGLVIPERVRTVFVEPDARLEERLRMESPG
jgi:predicted ribosome quality control (RQC) complex YloA/Tae2 family protein